MYYIPFEIYIYILYKMMYIKEIWARDIKARNSKVILSLLFFEQGLT